MQKLLFVALLLAGCAPSEAKSVPQKAGEEVEPAVLMLRMQTHMNKLWFAGEKQNWPLAAFYVHELEETLEEIVNAGIVDEGVQVSRLANAMLPPALDALEKAVKAKSDFAGAYDRALGACNTCHKASKHGFIVMQRPTQPMFSNQNYAPQ